MAHWVDVNDRLPPNEFDVLTMCAGELTLAYYNGHYGWNPSGAVDTNYDMSCVILEGTVTYWLEDLDIPELPTRG